MINYTPVRFALLMISSVFFVRGMDHEPGSFVPIVGNNRCPSMEDGEISQNKQEPAAGDHTQGLPELDELESERRYRFMLEEERSLVKAPRPKWIAYRYSLSLLYKPCNEDTNEKE